MTRVIILTLEFWVATTPIIIAPAEGLGEAPSTVFHNYIHFFFGGGVVTPTSLSPMDVKKKCWSRRKLCEFNIRLGYVSHVSTSVVMDHISLLCNVVITIFHIVSTVYMCVFLPTVPVGGTMGLQMDIFSFFSSSSSSFTPLTFQAIPGSPVTPISSYSFSYYFLERFCPENCPLLSGELSTLVRRTVHRLHQSSNSYFSSAQSSPELDIKLAQIWLTNTSQPWAGYKTGSLLLCHSFLCLRKTDSTVNTVRVPETKSWRCEGGEGEGE